MENWTRAALEDGAARAGERFSCAVEHVEKTVLADALAQWAADHRLDAVLVHEPMAGPWRAEGRAAEGALGASGGSLKWIRRKWDDELWPHATRGFFPYWEAVKRIHRLA